MAKLPVIPNHSFSGQKQRQPQRKLRGTRLCR